MCIMDKTLSIKHYLFKSLLQYRDFINLKHNILVFANFLYGIMVLGFSQGPQGPPQ